MLTEIRNFSYGEARYHVMKEIDTLGPIGRILTAIQPQLSLIMIRVLEQIDAITAWEPGEDDGAFTISQYTLDMFIRIEHEFPTLILTEDKLPWNDFMSAWCAIVHQYCSVFGNYLDFKLSNGPEDERSQTIAQRIGLIQDTLAPTYTLAQMGAGYLELMQASSSIVKELRSWRQSRPASLRLSQTYLTALGLVKPEEGPKNSDWNGSKPEECGCNPPPPPPPPPAN